mmetsp:Transcript_18768/g.58827  ORF Transcript_18768/g.58827 Transcript_18768/m.58827 type:complete len:235 (-) Transcript_18768:283-987(-)
MTGSKSASASTPSDAREQAQRSAAAPTAASMSWQRDSTRGRTPSARLRRAGPGEPALPCRSSRRAVRTALRAFASRSQSPKWRYRVQSSLRKVSGSAWAQRPMASKQQRRTSGSTSFVRRLTRATPSASRAAPRSREKACVRSSSEERDWSRATAPCACASLTCTAAELQKSLRERHCTPRPSTRCKPAIVAACRTLRNWQSVSARTQPRSTCRRPLSSAWHGAAAPSSRQSAG